MLELAFLVWGIIILTKRKFQLSSRKVVTGMPAILVGIMFVSLLPLGFVMGIILGVVMALNGAWRTWRMATLRTCGSMRY